MRGFPRIRTHGLGHASIQSPPWAPKWVVLSMFMSALGSVPDLYLAKWISAHRITASRYASSLLACSGVLVCHTA
ncbi:hypothetical protein J3E74DRAFT_382048 [Bipolaris maydis]|nr:hypothetical protein J3E74DRAFT_382048 [Bipolaris maydis]